MNMVVHEPTIKKTTNPTVQSCNLNFLIGSGCSIPAMKALGSIEQEVEALYVSYPFLGLI